jgi:hypothetical protein
VIVGVPPDRQRHVDDDDEPGGRLGQRPAAIPPEDDRAQDRERQLVQHDAQIAAVMHEPGRHGVQLVQKPHRSGGERKAQIETAGDPGRREEQKHAALPRRAPEREAAEHPP